jgi:hypothetical protein
MEEFHQIVWWRIWAAPVLATPFSSEEYTPAEKHRKESSNHDVQRRQEKKR